MSRFINGFLDLITIWFLSTFGKRPMHLFGLLGSIMFVIGFLFAFYLGIDKLFINTSGRLITERPQFYLSLTAMLIGTQLFLAGFLGEIILRTKNNEERLITEDNYDLITGWKKKRYDSVVAKNIPSKLFNWAARKTSGVHLNDFNCGLKAKIS